MVDKTCASSLFFPKPHPAVRRVVFRSMVCIVVSLFGAGCYFMRLENPCRCIPPYPWLLYRHEAKNDMRFDHFRKNFDTIAVNRIIGWQALYKDLKGQVNKSNHRLIGTPEETLYVLKGRLHYARQMFDCDFHMELGSMDTADKRIIVCEIPVQNCYQQRLVQQFLQKMGHELGEEIPGGIPCVVTGLGFYDGQHALPKGSGRASQWELHPVERVVFVQ